MACLFARLCGSLLLGRCRDKRPRYRRPVKDVADVHTSCAVAVYRAFAARTRLGVSSPPAVAGAKWRAQQQSQSAGAFHSGAARSDRVSGGLSGVSGSYVPPARIGSDVGALEPAAGSSVTATMSPALTGALRTIVNRPPEPLTPAAIGRCSLITQASHAFPVGGLESSSTTYGSPLRGITRAPRGGDPYVVLELSSPPTGKAWEAQIGRAHG